MLSVGLVGARAGRAPVSGDVAAARLDATTCAAAAATAGGRCREEQRSDEAPRGDRALVCMSRVLIVLSASVANSPTTSPRVVDAVARLARRAATSRSARAPAPEPNPHLIRPASPGSHRGTRNFHHSRLKNVRLPAEFREDEAGGICARSRSRGPRGGDPRRKASDGGVRRRRDEGTTARPQAIRPPMQTAEIDVARDRRVTLTSPIPAIIADSMVRERSVTPRRDPAAPQAASAVEQTRRVGDSDPVRSGAGPTLKSDVGVAPWRQRAAQRIDEARAALDAGDLSAAVTAAESALHEADEAPAPGIVEVIEPARPLLNRVFTTYIGPSTRPSDPGPARRRDRAAAPRRPRARRPAANRRQPHAGRAVRRLRAWDRWMPCASSRGSFVRAPSASSDLGRNAHRHVRDDRKRLKARPDAADWSTRWAITWPSPPAGWAARAPRPARRPR